MRPLQPQIIAAQTNAWPIMYTNSKATVPLNILLRNRYLAADFVAKHNVPIITRLYVIIMHNILSATLHLRCIVIVGF